MKIVQSVSFQHEVEGRMYCLTFPMPAPLGECYDVAAAVCSEFLKKMKEEELKLSESRLAESKSKESSVEEAPKEDEKASD